jgi:predicted amidohydrolase YtcJ
MADEAASAFSRDRGAKMRADLVLRNGGFTTLDCSNPTATAVEITGGVFTAVGSNSDVMQSVDPDTRIIDLAGRRVLPGRVDNHLHIIRGGLNYNKELRWDGVRSLADAMAMLKRQVPITPPPQWVRVVGGYTAHQFAEKRLPTIEEINAIAPDTPVFLLHLYDRAMLNGAALRVVGSSGRGDRPRCPRQSDRPADCQAQCQHPLCDASRGSEAAVRLPDQFDAPFDIAITPQSAAVGSGGVI